VLWAQRRAHELGLTFDGTPETINRMIKHDEAVAGGIYFDYGRKGNHLSRPAFDELRRRIAADLTVSHLFIPRRDRLARPDEPEDAIAIENELRRMGVTLVFMGKTLTPLKPRQRRDVSEAITALLEYDQSGRFLPELAQKMIYAQLRLAKGGYSTGGEPPFGFHRVLVRADGAIVRPLADGEVVRQSGHHVVWLPGPEEELASKLALIRRILQMLKTTSASQVARTLTKEGIPSPGAGRMRKDGGVRHQVSGVWHQTTIVNIARNPLIRAVARYGQRSMGEHLRMSSEGPRELDEQDYRSDKKPKVIRNPESAVITAPAKFAPLIPLEEHDELLQILDARAGTQRGKPRSRDPQNNPLGGRVFDLACTWPMYRTPYNGSFRYTCGLYQQSHAAQCKHNHVDGAKAARFVLAAIRQRLLSPAMLARLEQRLRSRVQASGKSLAADAGEKQRALLREFRRIWRS
jgi:hypothetical protein